MRDPHLTTQILAPELGRPSFAHLSGPILGFVSVTYTRAGQARAIKKRRQRVKSRHVQGCTLTAHRSGW